MLKSRQYDDNKRYVYIEIYSIHTAKLYILKSMPYNGLLHSFYIYAANMGRRIRGLLMFFR